MSISDQGRLNNRYAMVARTLIFLTNNNRLLLLKGASGKRLWANLYNGIGGHIERDEDILSAAQRELTEETGLDYVSLRLCGVITIDTGQENGVAVFVIRGETDQEGITSSAEGMPEWIEFDRLAKLPLVEDLPELLPRVMSHRPGEPPFSAHYQALPGSPLNIEFYQ